MTLVLRRGIPCLVLSSCCWIPIVNCIHRRLGTSGCSEKHRVVFCSVHAESNARRGARCSCRPHDSQRAKPPRDKRGAKAKQNQQPAAADQSLPVPFARIRFRCFPGQKPGPGFDAAISCACGRLPAAAMDLSALPSSWNWNHRFDATEHGAKILPFVLLPLDHLKREEKVR
ncbi:hypothetical protein GQ55_7G274200 [Panicum hallii var. hallii]|uniref:Secreted protein n=1 Tax=Panicum hallii var. hallii TaxID=1504633 RepID=A0A2T7CZK8_9POAL|nr:hypothetical protein GQ55_7G274200 [Panicum hallii var. hallii]